MDSIIFKFVYIVAMRDATLQRSYDGKKKWLMDCKKFPNSSEKLKKFIDDVVKEKFDNQSDYDKRFITVAESICEEINSKAQKNEFTFGNAQKLINIMMKYYYIHTYNSEKAKNAFRFCHCPMDGQLLKAVWEKRNDLSNPSMLGKSDDFMKSWGKEEFELINGEKAIPIRYLMFQKAVKELSQSICIKERNLFPLEYDYYIWGVEAQNELV